MGFKKIRFGTKIVEAAKSGRRYSDCHVFFGGTGAVGGTAVLQMLALYERMMAIEAPKDDEVPIIVATARTREEIEVFTARLFRFVQAMHGKNYLPTRVRNGYLTHSGVFISLERFQVVPLPGLERLQVTPPSERRDVVAQYLRSIGSDIEAGANNIYEALKQAIAKSRPFSTFLEAYHRQHLVQGRNKFRSVHLCIPLPSLMAYHLLDLEIACSLIEGMGRERTEDLKEAFVLAIRDDVALIQEKLAENVIVAHTTSVGGMFDEEVAQDGTPKRTIRLGFAHSALDTRLKEKQKFAEKLTELYAAKGIKMLITAAAIGIDEVRVSSDVPVHKYVGQMLFDAEREVFPGSKAQQPPESRASREAGRPVPVRQVIRVFRPLTVPLEEESDDPVSFERGEDLKPSFVIRSGENGFFTVANAEALYRVMRVASASELGLVMASTGLFGDDPLCPWFKDNLCYYTETDNSRAVFDFLSQPLLRNSQLSGLEPMALQDLGSAKHQAELHTLGLLILLHRLRTLDIDAIPPYVDLQNFDEKDFFIKKSRPLTFEDVIGWDMEELARDLRLLLSAEEPEDLEFLTPFRGRMHDDLYPKRQLARRKVLEAVLKASWMPCCIGSPVIFEKDGKAVMKVGYYVAPLDLLVERRGSVMRKMKELYNAAPRPYSFEQFRDYHICAGGFIDLRPHAILCTATNPSQDLGKRVKRFQSVIDLRKAIREIEPFSVFSMCGLLAVIYRLHAMYATLREASVELGTLPDFRWHMPRDEQGHILLVPGIVEALRMVSEGLEKNTGTEFLDGIWGYERPEIEDRREALLKKRS